MLTVESATIRPHRGADVAGGPWTIVWGNDESFDIYPLPISDWRSGAQHWAERASLHGTKVKKMATVDVVFELRLKPGASKARVSPIDVTYHVEGSGRTYTADGTFDYILKTGSC